MSNVIEDRILDFLDGHLESTDEEELLHRLAVSPEKRGLLREHLKLREAVTGASKTEQLSVPTNVTASLYRKLAYNGYSGASLGTAVSVTRPMLSSSPAAMIKSAPVIKQGYQLASVLSFAVLSFFVGVGATSLLDQNSPSEARLTARSISGNTLFGSSKSNPVKTLSNPRGEMPAERPYSAWQPVPYEQRQKIEVEPLLVYSGVAVASAVANALAQETALNTNEHPTINSSFFEDREVELVERIPIRDLSFDVRATNVGVGYSRSFVNKPSGPVETPELDESETHSEPSYITGGGAVSEVDPMYPSLRGNFEEDVVSPVDFNFGDYAKAPASTYLSIRSGGGRLPGSDLNFSGSLSELRLSYQLSERFVIKASVGEFAPWENVAQGEGTNGDGVTLIGIKPTLNFRYVLGAEAGLKLNPFSIPLEISAGGLFDENGLFYPRGSILSTVSLTRDFSILLGLEAVLYSFDVGSSIAGQMSYYKGKNPAVRDGLPKRTLSGFIGPTIEAAWHF
jgi:hypothetical protein